jgi:hypothetical protein
MPLATLKRKSCENGSLTQAAASGPRPPPAAASLASRQSRAALRRKSLARVPTLGVIDARSTGMHGRVRDGRYLRDFS